MEYKIPDDRKYTTSHEWATQTNARVRIGITDFAQDELGDVVFVELPAEGTEFDENEAFGVIESIKAVSDIYTPISGEVTAINKDLENEPALVNDDPYGAGWLIELETETDLTTLLSPPDYQEEI